MSSLVEDPTQIGKGFAVVKVLDINDNAPLFAMDYETLLCENAMAGQVRRLRDSFNIFLVSSAHTFRSTPADFHNHKKKPVQSQHPLCSFVKNITINFKNRKYRCCHLLEVSFIYSLLIVPNSASSLKPQLNPIWTASIKIWHRMVAITCCFEAKLRSTKCWGRTEYALNYHVVAKDQTCSQRETKA